jgi:ubiquinone/menaquinone biosynthesis C-methylase UbiE
VLRTGETLQHFAASADAAHWSVLEINEAGTLSPVLRQLGRHVFASYPQVDIHALPYESGSFDLVVHSDTLEHVAHPVHALRECRRVLRPGGAMCFTVPTIVARLSRDRTGLQPSYHGNPASNAEDYMVQTEFGADAWTLVLQAGFTQVSMHSSDFPACLAYVAQG